MYQKFPSGYFGEDRKFFSGYSENSPVNVFRKLHSKPYSVAYTRYIDIKYDIPRTQVLIGRHVCKVGEFPTLQL